MKIGLISDIHGDAASLLRAINTLRWLGVTQILCAGGLTDGGDDGAVIENLCRADVQCVQGNHDRELLLAQSKSHQDASSLSSALLLNPRTAAYLIRLPTIQRFQFDGVSLFLGHGTPWNPAVALFPNCKAEKFQCVAGAAEADVVILGNTHIPMHVRIGAIHIVNPGSVYRNYFSATDQTCAVLEEPRCAFTVYDINGGHPVPHDAFVFKPNEALENKNGMA